MATVDIEPASLAVTPGESEVLTLTVRNDGDVVEAYHVTAVDDAVAHVVIAPDTLLVQPGETVTAEATLTLERTGRSPLGVLIVRFQVVPAGRPDEFLVVEAIVTIQSFSDVTAVLSPPALTGRRSGKAEVAITNAGNADTYAEVSVSAGELSPFITQSRVALPAGSTESVELSVRAAALLWRGEPVQHPFVVTVTPEGEQSISLDGTFTRLPVFAKWAFVAAISAAAVIVAALLVWVIVAALSGISGPEGGETTTASPSEAPAPPRPEPDVEMVVAVSADDAVRAGDTVAVALKPDVKKAPKGSLLAVEVKWPEGLVLTDDECEAWVAPDTDRALKSRPRSGDECVLTLSGRGSDAELVFATPPAGFTGAVSAGATRLVTLDRSEVTTLATGPDSDFGAVAAADITLAPYLFWMEVVDAEPSDWGPDAKVIIHHVMRGDGTDREATMAFHIAPPAFVDRIVEARGCNSFEDSTCSVYFGTDSGDPTNTTWEVDVWFAPDDARGIGTLSVTGASLTGVASNEVNRSIRSGEGVVVSERMFGVDVRLDSDEDPAQGESVTATIEVIPLEIPAEVSSYADGSWILGLELAWPGGLRPVGTATGCTLVDRICTLPALAPGETATIRMAFVVDDPEGSGEVRASGATLSYDPTTAADGSDDREQPRVSHPSHWIGSDAEWFPR